METAKVKKRKGCSSIIALIALLISGLTFWWFRYDLNLKNRPYLYVEIEYPKTWLYTDPKTNTSGHRKINIDFQVSNEGPVPASNIKFDWYVATDMDGELIDPDEFLEMENKKAPKYGTVFPKQTVDLLGYNPDISPAAKKIFLYVVVSYEGVAKNFLGFWGNYKKYWYLLRTEYELLYYQPNDVGIAQIYYETDWDREQNIDSLKANPQAG
ncbi:MAG: hypothetical protein ISS45_09780 [Candidatus Omnitrophica bacterium]|nr:hypothetical protein [Candidatus Omnitrophota bacterium]